MFKSSSPICSQPPPPYLSSSSCAPRLHLAGNQARSATKRSYSTYSLSTMPPRRKGASSLEPSMYLVLTRSATPATGKARKHNPWKDPLALSFKAHIRQVKTTLNEVEPNAENEPTIYRPINQMLTFLAMTNSMLLAIVSRYLSVGPQGPVYATARPTPVPEPPTSGSKCLHLSL